ncbi:MAG: taurine catabolism dioxygenase TauD [Gammaproteobacteria bacterium]|nr:taurine catabolism dioxygenase TauD [Gammaproteobacteria bacterium]NIN39632.1 taurine catabolism dioxygenase TauD [Gammaproteobacteria bacterium]NIO25189.1 taurine catabolism dioxygenase TauD [Gammaproteobacteria bacterium]NIO65818.1 taurine catabolism dioxygenase TauD [Gammaproteobacteria bacterium]NIP45743.1 TauD/TfdA family dioxygenase [Gammaproteobacteria bacterium]
MPESPARDLQTPPSAGPFSLDDEPAYRRWRARKLGRFPASVEALWVSVARLGRPSEAERSAIAGACRRANFALYRTDPRAPPAMDDLRAFAGALGLRSLDLHPWAPQGGIAALRREDGNGRGEYIPYTDRAMRWHTDGYYNTQATAVRGVIMHCVSPAASGGANWLLDPEMLYIALRDIDPACIETLMQPDVMTIPENTLSPELRRPAVTGPVFSVCDDALHMRYTARTRSIRWKQDTATRKAVALLDRLLTPPVAHAFRVGLAAGEGIICNNVLHEREAFRDDPINGRERLLWRARYRERVADKGAEPLAASQCAT